MCFMCVYKQTPPDEREALVEAFFNAAGDVLNEALDDGESPTDDARFAAKAQILADMIRGQMPGQGGISRLSDILTQLFKDTMQGDGKVDLSELKGRPTLVAVKIDSGDSLETIQAKTKAAMDAAGPFPKTPVNVGNTPSVNLGADFEFPDGKWPANNVFPLKPTKH